MKHNFLYPVFSVPVFGLLYLFTAIIVLTAIILSILRIRKAVRATINFWAKGIFVFLFQNMRVSGIENIKKDHKYILVTNHASIFDIPAVMCFTPDVSWFGREYLVKIPVFGTILKMIDFIPMRNGSISNTKEMLSQLIEKSNSKTIAMFPEGTRTLDGNFQRFKKGFIYVMRASQIDILPVTLNGLFRLKPKTRFSIDFSAKTNVVIHEAIKFEELNNLGDEEIISRVKNVMESAYFF